MCLFRSQAAILTYWQLKLCHLRLLTTHVLLGDMDTASMPVLPCGLFGGLQGDQQRLTLAQEAAAKAVQEAKEAHAVASSGRRREERRAWGYLHQLQQL